MYLTPAYLLVIFGILFSSVGYGQSTASGITTSDTLVVNYYRSDGKVEREDIYFKGNFIAVKNWYYNKDVYGYWLKEKGKTKTRIKLGKEFYSDGHIRIEGATLNGERHGPYKTYFQNGQSQCDCNYKEGNQDGSQKKYYENGHVDCLMNYKDGRLDGRAAYYFDNGQLWSERIYREGKAWEVLSNFDKNGNTLEKGTLKDGNGTLFIYDENGKLTDLEHYKEGKLIKKEKRDNLSLQSDKKIKQ